jgi:hypothetical protein
MKKSWVHGFAIILGALAAILYACTAPVHHEDPAWSSLVSRAVGGELDAIREVQARYRAAGMPRNGEETRWALIGAMEGADDLATVFLQDFEQMTQAEREGWWKIIRKNESKPGTQALIARMKNPQ